MLHYFNLEQLSTKSDKITLVLISFTWWSSIGVVGANVLNLDKIKLYIT